MGALFFSTQLRRSLEQRNGNDLKVRNEVTTIPALRVMTILLVSKAKFQAKAPKFGNRANIYDKENSDLLIASLRLDKLGWNASWQRFRGKCNEIYTVNAEVGKSQPLATAVA